MLERLRAVAHRLLHLGREFAERLPVLRHEEQRVVPEPSGAATLGHDQRRDTVAIVVGADLDMLQGEGEAVAIGVVLGVLCGLLLGMRN